MVYICLLNFENLFENTSSIISDFLKLITKYSYYYLFIWWLLLLLSTNSKWVYNYVFNLQTYLKGFNVTFSCIFRHKHFSTMLHPVLERISFVKILVTEYRIIKTEKSWIFVGERIANIGKGKTWFLWPQKHTIKI